MRGSLQRVTNRQGELVWRAQWREAGQGRTRILGRCVEMGRAEARAVLDTIIATLPAGRAASRSVTVERFVLDDYLVAKSSIWKRSTEATTTSLIERHILPAIGRSFLQAVTRRELQRLLDSLALGLSKSIVQHVRFQLRAIFDLAEGDGHLRHNPTRGSSLPRGGRERVAPAVADETKISEALMRLDLRDRLFVAFCVWRGMRPGEVAALKVGDVVGDWITVERRVYRGQIDTPKSALGHRRIPIESLRSQIDAYVGCLLDQRPEAWLFPSETGRPISPPNLYRRRLKPVFDAVGLDRFSFQSMRATFNTRFREVEPDAKVRADILGHTVEVNEQVYRQSTGEQRRTSIRKFDQGRPQ